MRKNLLIVLAAIMLFATACSSSNDSNNAALAAASTDLIDTSKSVSESSEITSTNSTAVSDNISSIVESNQEPETSSFSSESQPKQSTDKEESALSIMITVNGREFSAALYDNETAREFKKRLPLTLDMSELNGNEKFYYLPESLPKNSSRPSRINTGDIMLYGSDCLVIFYESFSTSYSYTPIGKIDDPAGLSAALGSGDVQVTFN